MNRPFQVRIRQGTPERLGMSNPARTFATYEAAWDYALGHLTKFAHHAWVVFIKGPDVLESITWTPDGGEA